MTSKKVIEEQKEMETIKNRVASISLSLLTDEQKEKIYYQVKPEDLVKVKKMLGDRILPSFFSYNPDDWIFLDKDDPHDSPIIAQFNFGEKDDILDSFEFHGYPDVERRISLSKRQNGMFTLTMEVTTYVRNDAMYPIINRTIDIDDELFDNEGIDNMESDFARLVKVKIESMLSGRMVYTFSCISNSCENNESPFKNNGVVGAIVEKRVEPELINQVIKKAKEKYKKNDGYCQNVMNDISDIDGIRIVKNKKYRL